MTDRAAEFIDPALLLGLLARAGAPADVGSWAAPEGSPLARTRWQDAPIAAEIADGSSVLDLGCGDGELLARLVAEKHVRVQGVEKDSAAVMRCIERGVPVLQCDLDLGLQGFGDHTFDTVILEETLPTLTRPLEVLDGLLRVGRRGIVSFPNAAFWRLRFELALRGRVPQVGRFGGGWHDNPFIRPFSLQDFLDWVARAGACIERGWALSRDGVKPLQADDNLFAEEVLIVLKRCG